VLRDQDVPGVLPFRRDGDRKPRRQLGGDVLQAVDRQIDVPPKEGVLDLFDEDPLAADLDQGHVLHDVPLRLDDRKRHPHAGVPSLDPFLHPVSLGQGEGAAPRADSQGAANHASPFSPPAPSRRKRRRSAAT